MSDPFNGRQPPITLDAIDHATRSGIERIWDRFVACKAGGDLVQTVPWARSKAALGFSPLLFWSIGDHGRIEGGGILIAKHFRIPGIGWPRFTVGYVARGPVVDGNDPAVLDRVLNVLDKSARQSGVNHLIVQPPFGREDIQDHLHRRGFVPGAPSTVPGSTVVIDLTAPQDTILAKVSPSLRRNLNKSRKGGLVIRKGKVQDIAVFHALHSQSACRQRFTPLSYDYLISQWNCLSPTDAVHFFLASSPDEPDRPIAGTWITAFAGTVTYKIPAWSGEAANLVPSIACIWATIMWGHQNGFTCYDLGGLDPATAATIQDREPGANDQRSQGPAAFKTRFGGRLLQAPDAMERTLTFSFRPVVSVARAGMKASPGLRRLVDRVRNG